MIRRRQLRLLLVVFPILLVPGPGSAAEIPATASTPSLVLVGRFNAPGFHPFGIAYDPSTDHLHIADGGGGGASDTIFEMTRSGVFVSLIARASYGGTDPNGVAVDPFTGDFLITDNVLGTLFRVSRSGMAISHFPTRQNDGPAGVAVDASDGILYTTDGGGIPSALYCWAASGQSLGDYDLARRGLTPNGTFGVVSDPLTGHLFMPDFQTGMLHELTTDGVVVNVYELRPFGITSPAGIGLDPVSRHLFFVDQFDNEIVELALSGTVPVPVRVSIDIAPGRCPNRLSSSHANLIVAITGTGGFEASNVDPSSVRIAGISPIKNRLGDVAAPPPGTLPGCVASSADGTSDLVLRFSAPAVRAGLESSLGRPLRRGETILVTLSGALLPSAGGADILGHDTVLVSN
jgi:DNA-binding beta-propeller fold protein YncE